jgi:hypothetical protein
MTAQTRTVLKALFEDGDTPAGSDYTDWIDSMVAIADTTAQTMTSDLHLPKLVATTEVSAVLVRTPLVSASVMHTNVLHVDGKVSASSMAVTGIISASAANFGILRATDVSASSLSATGPVRSGTSGAVGLAVLTQQTTVTDTVSANTTVAVVPDGSDVLDVYLQVKTAFATAAADVEIRVGTSANETLFGTFKLDSSAQIVLGMHKLTEATANVVSAGTKWSALAGAGAKIMAQVTAVSGAVASGGEGIISVIYVQK